VKPDREKAEKRAKILWHHYHERGKLLIADIKPLAGVPRDTLYDTFSRNNINAPPVWDSQIEKTRRKAIALNDKANELQQSFLTKKQAAKVLNVKPSQVTGVTIQIAKRGHKFPKIIDETKDIFVPIHGRINPFYYPVGLQVLSWYEGPKENEITYLLR
jgi:hypothetical protein